MSTLVTREEPEVAITRKMLTPLSIFEEMDRLTREVQERAFNLFEERGGSHGWDLSDWFRAESEFVRPMPMDVEEQEKEFLVKAEIPGFEAKEITVSVDPHHVRVYGKTEQREKEPQREEPGEPPARHLGEISRNEVLREIALPGMINPDLATARLDKGILEVRLPKAAPPKLIEVKMAA